MIFINYFRLQLFFLKYQLDTLRNSILIYISNNIFFIQVDQILKKNILN